MGIPPLPSVHRSRFRAIGVIRLFGRAVFLAALIASIPAGSRAQFFKPLGKPLGLLMSQDGTPNQWLGSAVGSLGDINGDGKPDFAVGKPNANARYDSCYIYFGGVGVLDGKADIALDGGGNEILSGDFNGDGRRDFVTCGRRNDTTIHERTTVTRYYEQKALTPYVDSLPTRVFPEIHAEQASFQLITAGDMNGDGFDDLMIYTPYKSYSDGSKNTREYLTLYFGGNPPFTRTMMYRYRDDHQLPNGSYVTYAKRFLIGDIDGDGCGDLLVVSTRKVKGMPNDSTDEYMELFYGKKDLSQKDSIPDAVFLSSEYPFLDYRNAYRSPSLVDLNGDGIPDLAFMQGDSLILVQFGRKEKTATLGPFVTLADPDYADFVFVPEIKMIGDMNGDGYDDFVITMYARIAPSIFFIVYLCGPNWYTKPAYYYHYPGFDSGYIRDWCGIGDQNGDGGTEILISRMQGYDYDKSDWGNFVIVKSDTILRLGVPNNKQGPVEIELSVYPNPADGSLNIQFTLAALRQEQVDIVLFDSAGRERMKIFSGTMEPGSHLIALERKGLSPGAYIARMRTASSTIERKVIIMR